MAPGKHGPPVDASDRDLAALLALFGALGLSALLLFRNRSLVAQTDPYFHQSLRYVSWP